MIEFKCVHTDYEGNEISEVKYKVSTDTTLDELMQEFRCFLLACSYSPKLVDKYIEAN